MFFLQFGLFIIVEEVYANTNNHDIDTKCPSGSPDGRLSLIHISPRCCLSLLVFRYCLVLCFLDLIFNFFSNCFLDFMYVLLVCITAAPICTSQNTGLFYIEFYNDISVVRKFERMLRRSVQCPHGDLTVGRFHVGRPVFDPACGCLLYTSRCV